MPRKRVISPRQEEAEAFLGIIESETDEVEVSDSETSEAPVSEPVYLDEPPVPPPEYPSVDDYLRRQFLTERYGTGEPTDYERKLQALRNRL